MEAFSSPTVPIITKSFTITQPLTDAIATVNTNVSEQIGRSTIAPGVSAKPSATTVKTNVSERYDKITTASSASIKSSITDVNSATELPQGVLQLLQ